MNKKNFSKVAWNMLSLVLALTIGMVSFLPTTNVQANEFQPATSNTDGGTKPQAPALPQANEVEVSEDSTATVTTAEEFLTAYTNENISRIELANDIDLSDGPLDKHGKKRDLQPDVRAYKLMRSVQLDGKGYTFKSTRKNQGDQFTDNNALFTLGKITGQTYTVHLQNWNAWSRGLNYIKNYDGDEIEGWQLILDNVTFKRVDSQEAATDGFDEVHRVAKLARGHIFLRNNVYMQSTGENFYAGAITVEPGAKVFGVIDYHDYSTWWFPREAAKIEKAVNIGEGAEVELSGKPRYHYNDPTRGVANENITYPAIFSHWQAINVHRGAKLKATKPGHAFEFKYQTNGKKDKYINVFEDATLEGITTKSIKNWGKDQGALDDVHSNTVGHFYAAQGSIIKFESPGNAPTVNLKNPGSTVVLDSPAEYAITNTRRAAGAQTVHVGTGGQFNINNADINVWDGTKGARNFDDEADYQWTLSTLVANDKGMAIEGTKENENVKDGPKFMDVWNTTKYSRISGQSGFPVLVFGELDPMSEAHKSYTVYADVFGRPAQAGEVYIKVYRQLPDENGNAEHSVKELIDEGFTDADGKFKFSNKNNEFFLLDSIITAEAYRFAEQWAATPITEKILDWMPPAPVTINEPITPSTRVISGTDGQPGTTIGLRVNEKRVTLSTIYKVDDDGKWEFEVPSNVELKHDDVIQVLLSTVRATTRVGIADGRGGWNGEPFGDIILPPGTRARVVAEDNFAQKSLTNVEPISTIEIEDNEIVISLRAKED